MFLFLFLGCPDKKTIDRDIERLISIEFKMIFKNSTKFHSNFQFHSIRGIFYWIDQLINVTYFNEMKIIYNLVQFHLNTVYVFYSDVPIITQGNDYLQFRFPIHIFFPTIQTISSLNFFSDNVHSKTVKWKKKREKFFFIRRTRLEYVENSQTSVHIKCQFMNFFSRLNTL